MSRLTRRIRHLGQRRRDREATPNLGTVSHEDGRVVLRFGARVVGVELPPAEARTLATLLVAHAAQVEEEERTL